MMVFILHLWRRAHFDRVVLLSCAFLLSTWLPLVQAAGQDQAKPEVTQLRFEKTLEGLFVSAAVKFELPGAVEDALLKGIPMVFVAEIDIFRDRWYWYDKKLISAERHMRLAYHPLTRRWRVNVASGQINPNSLGLALNQSYESLNDALAVIRRLSNWKIAESSDLELDPKNSVQFRFRLDISQLPRPFQIGALGQTDWDLSVSVDQRFVFEPAK